MADGEEDAARATAESVAARVQGGEDFAAVAAEVSADAGTKTQGGDLGWIGRGMLVGPFEDALFAMQVGEISAPVRTEFGFHIIRLDELRAGEVQSFEAVREELAAETRTRQAESEFYDRANELGEAAFDAYSELATVASSMNLPIKTLMAFPRSGDTAAFTNSAAVVQAAFADEIVDNGRNSELVELAEDHVLVLRVVAHHVPTTKPLDEVREQIREELTRERAQQRAEEAADALLDGPRARRRSCRARGSERGHLHARGVGDANGRCRADGSLVGGLRHAEDGGRRGAARDHRARQRRPGRHRRHGRRGR